MGGDMLLPVYALKKENDVIAQPYRINGGDNG